MTTDKNEIIQELANNLNKLVLFNVYKENQFCFDAVGKLEIDLVDKGIVYYKVKGFSFNSDSINDVEKFGAVLRIQIRP